MHSKSDIVVKHRKSLENGTLSKVVPFQKVHEMENQIQGHGQP